MLPSATKYYRRVAVLLLAVGLLAAVGCSHTPAKPLTRKAASPKRVEFDLQKVEKTESGEIFCFYRFWNKEFRKIAIPYVTFGKDGIGSPSLIGFEVQRDGKWINPGFYREAVPAPTYLEAGQEIVLRVEAPAHLWAPTTKFRLLFGAFVSEPARLSNFLASEKK